MSVYPAIPPGKRKVFTTGLLGPSKQVLSSSREINLTRATHRIRQAL